MGCCLVMCYCLHVLLSGYIKKIPEPYHIRFPSPILIPLLYHAPPVSYLIIRLVLASFRHTVYASLPPPIYPYSFPHSFLPLPHMDISTYLSHPPPRDPQRDISPTISDPSGLLTSVLPNVGILPTHISQISQVARSGTYSLRPTWVIDAPVRSYQFKTHNPGFPTAIGSCMWCVSNRPSRLQTE